MKHLHKQGLRRCYLCKEILPISSFWGGKKNRYECKKCASTHGRGRLIKKLGAKCNSCGLSNEDVSFFDIDHIKPLLRKRNGLSRAARYTKQDIPNLQVLCPNCHRRKTMEEVRNGSYQ